MTLRLGLLVVLVGTLFLAPKASGQQTTPKAEELEGLSGEELDELDALLQDDSDEGRTPLTHREINDITGLAVVLGFAMFTFFTKRKALKYVALALSVLYLGFYKASLVSVVNIYGIVQGNLPTFRYSIPWYLFIGFTLVSTVLWGRLYCGRICAFGALTQLLDAILPEKLRVYPPSWLDRAASYVKYAVLAVVMLYLLSGGDLLAYRYVEPFWVFTLSGNTIAWTLLAALLVATVFVRNLYCRYLCSVGAALGLASNLALFCIKRWRECRTCKICEKACEWGAIRGPKIIASECVRCDDCERIYADENKCVHWLRLRKSAEPLAIQTSPSP